MTRGDVRRVGGYLAPYWRQLAIVLGLSFLSTLLALYLPYLTKDLVDRALLGRDRDALQRVVLLFVAAGLASFVLNVISGMRYTETSARILFDMRLALYEHLQRLSPRFYARTRIGDIVSRLNNDIGEIQRIASEAALAWVGNVLFLAGTLVLLAWLDVRVFLASIACAPLSIWAQVHFRRRLEGRVRTLRERSADIGSFLIETLQAMRLIVASNAQSREVQRFRRLNDQFIEALMAMQWTSYLSGGVPGLLLSAGTAVVFLYGGSRVIAGTLSMGTFAACMAYQMRIMSPVQALMGLYASLAVARVSWRRLLELLDESPEVHEPQEAAPMPRARGDVALEDVTLSYDRGGPVLERVNLTVRQGEAVAIVGASGSGKSTIADLLLRLVDPDAGRVTLDGVDLKTLRLADVRRHVVLAEQTPLIFHASLAENIRYARPDASDALVADAARTAGLDLVVDEWPQRYQTVVGERGLALSVGERQRVAIARAVLADPAVLILDEPTASLDEASERSMADALSRVMRGRTTIIITHRKDLAARVHRIVRLDGAHLAEHALIT